MGRLNLSGMKERYEEMSRQNADYWRPDSGKTVIRFLPGWDSSDEETDTFTEAGCYPCIELLQHYLGGEVKKMVTCPETPGIDRDCPICDISRRYRKSKDEVKVTLGNDFRARRRAFWNVIVRNKQEEGIKVYPTPMGVHEALFEYGLNDGPWKDFFDQDAGCDVELTRKGSGLGTVYSIMPLPDRCGLGKSPEESTKLLKEAPDLTQFLKAPDRGELIRLLKKMEGDPDVPFNEDLGASPADDLETPEQEESVQGTLPPPQPAVAATPQATAKPAEATSPEAVATPTGSAQQRLKALKSRIRGGQ